MHTIRKKKFDVLITGGDRAAVRATCPNASLATIDRRAVARAAARVVLVEIGSTAEALSSLTSGIPKSTLHAWMRRELAMAA